MKNVRLFYSKTGRLKFISHLDMTRFMSRIITRSKIPVWYTEGFNQHVYMNFALPLSLGFESVYEVVDFRLNDDGYSLDECSKQLFAAGAGSVCCIAGLITYNKKKEEKNNGN